MKPDRDFKILACEISEMITAELGDSFDIDGERLCGDIYKICHCLSSECCYNPKEIWDEYKEGYKEVYGEEVFNYWDNKIKQYES
jgi:hypothetical protein